jgi:uncharacterized YigZ family protein
MTPTAPDAFRTLAAPSTGTFKDRGSKFFAYAFPSTSEEDALAQVDAIRKEHFKARHHCFAWRLGLDGQRFRTNDDGEPSGTAGKPILGQIDSAGLVDIVIVVVRYFGGTLLGTSGLIQAYRESAAEAIRQAEIIEKILLDHVRITAEYALVPDLINAVKKLDLEILEETYNDTGTQLQLGIRQGALEFKLLQLKAHLWKTSPEEAQTLDWLDGMTVTIL